MRSDDCLAQTGHKTVDDTLRNLRAITGKDWRIEKHLQRSGFFRKRLRELFCLYIGVGDGIMGYKEFQIVNFYRDGTDWSINHYVPAELLVAYMYGASQPSAETQGANDATP